MSVGFSQFNAHSPYLRHQAPTPRVQGASNHLPAAATSATAFVNASPAVTTTSPFTFSPRFGTHIIGVPQGEDYLSVGAFLEHQKGYQNDSTNPRVWGEKSNSQTSQSLAMQQLRHEMPWGGNFYSESIQFKADPHSKVYPSFVTFNVNDRQPDFLLYWNPRVSAQSNIQQFSANIPHAAQLFIPALAQKRKTS